MLQKIKDYSFTLQILLLTVLLTCGAVFVFRFFKTEMIRGVFREEQVLESAVFRTYSRENQRIGLLIQSLKQLDLSSEEALQRSLAALTTGYGPDGQIPHIIGEVPVILNEDPLRPGEFQIRTTRGGQDLPEVSLLLYTPSERPELLIQVILDREGIVENYIKPAVREALEGYSLSWITPDPEQIIPHGRDRDLRAFPFRPLAALTGWTHDSSVDFVIPLPDEFDLHRPFIPDDRGESPRDGETSVINPDFTVKPDQVPSTRFGTALVLGYDDAPYYRDIERKTALTWLLSNLILAGTGLVFLILIMQMRRLKTIRSLEKEFVASMTHELRTPLTVIQSAADNLSSGIIPPEKVERYGRVMKDQAGRLSGMIEEILLFSSMEGRHNGSREQVDLRIDSLLEDLKAGLSPLADEKNTRIIWDGEGFPEGVMSYPEETKLILNNLISNALYHGGGSPVRVVFRCRTSGTLAVTVEDEGAGIPAREQKKVFEPFYRTLYSRENQTRGSGLGLHIALKKARVLGGTLKLESPYERNGVRVTGCRFTLSLPCTFAPGENT